MEALAREIPVRTIDALKVILERIDLQAQPNDVGMFRTISAESLANETLRKVSVTSYHESAGGRLEIRMNVKAERGFQPVTISLERDYTATYSPSHPEAISAAIDGLNLLRQSLKEFEYKAQESAGQAKNWKEAQFAGAR